jgi:hypothetical protein
MELALAHPYNFPMRYIFRVALTTLLITIATGCATQETPAQQAKRVEPMLSAAGFHVHPADTPARQAQMQSLTPLKMRFYPRNGKMHYWFADPYYCDCIYSGNEQAYAAYQQIRLQQQMVHQQEMTAQINEDAASQESMDTMMWQPDPFFY